MESTNFPDSAQTIKRLGGTIKICEPIGVVRNSPIELADRLNEYIPEGKIEFSVNDSKSLGIETKKRLKNLGRSARYIEANNTATVIYNNLVKKGADIIIVNNIAFATKGIQSIDEFSARDFGRPGRDDESGMLPPKLAMMMINLATQPLDSVIYDPFCGSGTVVTEAMLMGYKNIIGSDSSEVAINDTQKNVTWLLDRYNLDINNFNLDIFQYDATLISKRIKQNSIDAIVAEPFLGKPMRGNELISAIESQASELKYLYTKAFAEMYKVLKPNGIIVFIIPRFHVKNEWVKIDCEKEIEKLGFENASILPDQKHLLYWRETQHVGREIWRFRKI